MNPALQKNLIRARADLRAAQEDVAKRRRAGFLNSIDRELYDWSMQCMYDAIDRVWDAQCMAEGSFR